MRWVVLLLTCCLVAASGYWYFIAKKSETTISPIGQLFEKPLEKYTIERLSVRAANAGPILLEAPTATTSSYTVYPFSYTTDGKKVTGLAHVPATASVSARKPVIVQVRGYVEQEVFSSGVGTKRSAEVFASHGFISLAPDFLGYGGSDNPSEDVFEERFQTYTATLDLLSAIPTLSMAESTKVGIWAHSNGGQIALTVLEATRKIYPTTLWAPVTKPFPYSILYYTDEAEDRGKALRKKLADFEDEYDVEGYTMVNFLDRIVAPLQLHQGTGDDAVPVRWSDDFVESLERQQKDIKYFVYPGADHNLSPSWNTVVERDLQFFTTHLLSN